MPEAILKYNLPEESGEYTDAINGVKYKSCLVEMDNWLRGIVKYEEMSASRSEVFQQCREKLLEIVRENEAQLD